MASQQIATDLSLGNDRPGVYIQINLEAPGGGVDELNRRLLILAYKRAFGTAAPNTPFQVLSQQDADDRSGRGSDGARGYAAAVAQIGAGNIDAFICPLLEPSGGQASTYNIIFSGTATASGAIDLTICGQPIDSVGVNIGDTAVIVAENIQAAIAELLDIPVTSTVNNATITLTYVHKGDVGDDLPIRVDITNATGIRCSPGSINFIGAPSNPGSVRVTIGATTITVILAG